MSTIALKKVTSICCNESNYEVRVFQNTNWEGKVSYSSEVALGPHDKIILDDRNIDRLEIRLRQIFPATLYSRAIAGMT
ncbi:MAG: hypothetical protein HYY20_01515 [Candidatus Tectomicrobia bacterium]|uniref:Uncharacterized protein n=1 Tax=Tectimicrobiota bacterium TaxID=2528274 RepID=A0A932CLD4_UNCTE|nr:hypothetical protein [Candidatus Tectomicrobia bacterium]